MRPICPERSAQLGKRSISPQSAGSILKLLLPESPLRFQRIRQFSGISSVLTSDSIPPKDVARLEFKVISPARAETRSGLSPLIDPSQPDASGGRIESPFMAQAPPRFWERHLHRGTATNGRICVVLQRPWVAGSFVFVLAFLLLAPQIRAQSS